MSSSRCFSASPKSLTAVHPPDGGREAGEAGGEAWPGRLPAASGATTSGVALPSLARGPTTACFEAAEAVGVLEGIVLVVFLRGVVTSIVATFVAGIVSTFDLRGVATSIVATFVGAGPFFSFRVVAAAFAASSLRFMLFAMFAPCLTPCPGRAPH
jgi:hypothetical protein